MACCSWLESRNSIARIPSGLGYTRSQQMTSLSIRSVFKRGAALLALAIATLGSENLRSEAGDVSRVLLQGGTIVMGTEKTAVEELKARYNVGFPGVFENETPAHTVTLGDFRIDRHEVTHARYASFLDENPYWQRDRLPAERHNGDYLLEWQDNKIPEGKGDHPVVHITWHSAQAFCQWAGGRLPTEAEWEYAARCGDDREFPWGNQLPSPELANYSASGHETTVPAGSYPAHDCGLQDLAGSVWEFLADAWVPEYAPGTETDPCLNCPKSEDEMVQVEGRRAVRGGSFGGSVVNLRTRWRDSHVVTNAIEFVGFRCAYPATKR